VKRFWIVFAAVILVVAGAVSYLASASPDGLDSATLQGCEVVEVDGAERLIGSCIARHATEHPMASSPLADYAVMGNAATGGVAGMLGAVLVLAIAFGAFRLIAPSRRSRS
jgi:cobalt/nickel transport protein